MTTDERRRAYYSQPNAARKELVEKSVFDGFATSSGLNVTNVRNVKPPFPDIACDVDGNPCYFELGEITDEELARDINNSLRKGVDSRGGFFSEEDWLVRILQKKTAKSYQTNGAPVDLILHYDNQVPFAPSDYMATHQASVTSAMKPSGPFSGVWIYDKWSQSVLWNQS